MAPTGEDILSACFEPQFDKGKTMTVAELIMKILESHSEGIQFREWNAGPRIDEQMKDNGFNISITTDWQDTGLCYGGNKDNCGTWMDKMGSADCNKGVPATPRDGAPIELVGLQYSVLTFLDQLHKSGIFPHAGVKRATFAEWAAKIKSSFNRCFYIPDRSESQQGYEIQSSMINRRCIYKDTFKSSHIYTDYQLRPNLCVAMAVAPELFERDQAKKCLQMVEDVLMTPGAMGIKTLDPKDRQYKGDYDNDDNTRGHNYHQGPEWVWPVGYFLISKMLFAQTDDSGDQGVQDQVANEVMKHLLPHQEHMLKRDPWHSLPELTNSEGKICHHSCPAQAWSIATLLDAIHRLDEAKRQN